jgi:hypothetical protein
MSDFDEEARKRTAALALLGDHGDGGTEEVHETLSQRDGLMTEEEVFGEDDLDRADRAQRQTPDDSLAQKSLIRQGVWGDLQKIAPFARTNPPSVLQGTVGGQQEVTSHPGGIIVNENGQQVARQNKMQVALWSGADAETLPLTVTFGSVSLLSELSNDTDNGAYRPYGIIKFGTRGFSVEAEVDIHRGTQFTVSGSSISLQVAMEPVPVGSVDPPGFMKLTGMVSFWPVTHRTPVTRTRYVDDLVVDANFSVPAFAKNFTVWRNDLGAGLFIELLNANLNTMYSYTIPAGGTLFNTIPLSGDILQVKVTNVGPSPTIAFVRAIFELAF